MKKSIKTIVALLIFFCSLSLCQAALGIFYDNNNSEVTVAWTNAPEVTGFVTQ